MKKLVSMLLVLMLCLGMTVRPRAAVAEEDSILGEPFPDFTVTDIDGNTFTLSEELKDHDAVLIHLFAAECGPCALEAPFLAEAHEQYGRRVAFVALSCEEKDTEDMLRAYREKHGLTFPVGRDEGLEIKESAGSAGLPATVIVDRFGNAAFFYEGSFKSTREVDSVIEAFLGEDITETAVLDGIPAVDATEAFPVGASREVYIENEDSRQILFTNDEPPTRLKAYIVGDSTAQVRMELPASDNPYDMVCYYWNEQCLYELPALLDAERGAYILDVPMADGEDGTVFTRICLTDWSQEDPANAVDVYLIPDEDSLDELCDYLGRDGWMPDGEDAEAPADREAPEEPEAYVLHVTDQYGEPVPGVIANFCTDTMCAPVRADEDGTITYEGEPDAYHVQLLMVPEGWSFDPDFEMTTGKAYGEWLLRIRRDAE